MPLSKEFYLEEIKSKYPNSYNESLKDLPVKDLEDMLDFLESALDKADGGPVGIEVLFTEKVPAAPSQLVSESDILLGYRGPGGYQGGKTSAVERGPSPRDKAMGMGGKQKTGTNTQPGGGGGGGKTTTFTSTPSGGENQKPPVVNLKKGFTQHNINNQKLKNAVRLGLITNDEYNVLGGYDVSQTMGMGPVDTAVASGLYNLYQSALGPKVNPNPQPFSEIFGDVKRNVKGASGISENLKAKYDNIMSMNPQEMTDRMADIELERKNMLADGGRVGLFMGGPPLEGTALSIYNSMNAYGFTDQEIANALAERGLYTPGGSTPDAPDQGIIGAQLNQDRDDGPKGDFGLFGNLLKDTEKTFIKDVYTEIAPGKFDFVPTEVTGYKNVKTGLYQTKEGKNINHLGIEVPTIAGMLLDKNFGKGPQVGDIKGTFTEGVPAGMKNFFKNPFNIFKKQQATLADINAMNKKAVDNLRAKQAAEEAAKRAAEAAARRELENRIISGGPVITGGGGGGNITTSAGTFAPGDYSDVAGTLADPREKMDYYRDGGLATMFRNKR